MDNKTVHIYIDTSIKGPRRRKGSYLYIVAMQTDKGTADTGKMVSLEDTTENQATLMALEAALKRLTRPCHIELYLECRYVTSALSNKWYEKWKENNWNTGKNEPVKDSEKWISILDLLNEHDFETHYREHHEYREWMQRELKKGEAYV